MKGGSQLQQFRREAEDCFSHLSGPLYRITRSWRPGFPSLARDAVQEAFHRAWRDWATVREFDDDVRLAWMARVARNWVIDNFRRAQTAEASQVQLHARFQSVSPSVHDQAMMNIAVAQLAKVIEAMPLRRRQVADLYYLGGLAGCEIAELLRISPSMVSQHLSAARSRLRTELKAHIPFDFREAEGDTS